MYILRRRMYSTSSRLAFAHSSGSSHQPLLSSHPSFPYAKQLLLIVVHEFPHFIFARDSSLCSCCFHERFCVSSLHLLPSSSIHASSALAGPLSAVPQSVERPGAPTFLFVLPPRLCCSCHPERVCAHSRNCFVTQSYVAFIFVNNSAYLPCIFCFSSSVRASAAPAGSLSSCSSHCSGNFAYPGSCRFLFLDCVVRTKPSVSVRANAFTLHPQTNLSRVGDRPHTYVVSSHAANPNMH